MAAEADELRARLERAKIESATIAARRDEGEELRALRDEVEKAERDARNAAALEKAELEHGAKKIAAVYTDSGVVIVKRPNHLLFRRFQDAGEHSTMALEKLVRPCLVHPDGGAFETILEELPGTLLRTANAVTDLALGRTQEVSKK
jgi:hypothetical protein